MNGNQPQNVSKNADTKKTSTGAVNLENMLGEIKLSFEGKIGTELISAYVKHLPNSPGVYRMMNVAGDVLYVGKARSLKKRVTNYAQGRGHSNRIARMIGETSSMEFIITHTEIEALLLEANLIKRLRPRYNVLLRDDKSFPYILVSSDHQSPALLKHRGARSRKGTYFGPFASAGAVDRTINSMQRAFLLRTCTDSVFESRTRPCLLHQIKRCAAPCTGEISSENYNALVNEAKEFLSGKSKKITQQMSESMSACSEALDFEQPALYRDRLAALTYVQSRQDIHPNTVEEADVFAIHHEAGLSCIQVFFFRAGQNWGNRSYFPQADKALDESTVLSAFISQFYDNKPCPRLILTSHEIEESSLISEAFSAKSERKVTLTLPQRGEKKDLVAQVLSNAREAHGRRLADTASQTRLLKGLAETFKLDYTPQRIEVYDNSHISGTNAVGGMIVGGREGFVKNQYRKFNIKSEDITPGDDYGMMAEVMERRFKRLIKEHGLPNRKEIDNETTGSEIPAWPDILLIDGGKGQLSAVMGVLNTLEISSLITVIGVAKGMDREAGRERFFLTDGKNFTLPPRDPVLYFIQRMRDEAHRYAIGSHRTRRKKEMIKNPLDEVTGIGPQRKRALLHHFGSAKATAQAGIEDLMQVDGISEASAKIIYEHFHDDNT